MTFKEWNTQQEEYEQWYESEVEENDEINARAQRKYWRTKLINACAIFFPDLPEIEGWILVGVRGL